MLKLILELLPYAKISDSNNIAIAKGKHKLPENTKELINYAKHLRNGNY
jgi:hypothetical protein